MPMAPTRRSLLIAAAAAPAALAALRGRSMAEETTFFRIASGSSGGLYYPLASLLAGALSNPLGSGDCPSGELCGVPGLIAVAQTSDGSISNLQALTAGLVESAFCQADLAHRAYRGSLAGILPEGARNLRVLAYLYPEYLHLVVRRGHALRRLADLTGRRISIGAEGSGTAIDAFLLLETVGITAANTELVQLSTVASAAALRRGDIDAFLLVSGVPANVVADLAHTDDVDLLPIDLTVAAKAVRALPGFEKAQIDPGVYHGIGYTPTLSTGALWLADASLSDALAHAVVETLWSPATADFLALNDPRLAAQLSEKRAVSGVGVPPLHPGAVRFYRQAGLLPAE